MCNAVKILQLSLPPLYNTFAPVPSEAWHAVIRSCMGERWRAWVSAFNQGLWDLTGCFRDQYLRLCWSQPFCLMHAGDIIWAWLVTICWLTAVDPNHQMQGLSRSLGRISRLGDVASCILLTCLKGEKTTNGTAQEDVMQLTHKCSKSLL